MSDLHPLSEAVIAGRRKEVPELVQACIDAGESAQFIVEDRLVPAMAVVGERFKNNEIFVPEMLIAARAMKEALKVLEPLLVEAGVKPEFNAVIGTVEGDLHDIGKNLVASLLEGGGFEVIDLGVNVPPEKFIASINEKQANIIAMSALLTTTMPAMKTTIDALKQAGVRSKVKVLIGGAPITQKYADEIGADGYSENAVGAVALAKRAVA